LRNFDSRCDFITTGVLVDEQKISLPAALQAQSALRSSAGLGPELFPIPEFVGMISDEIEQLRKKGKSDEDIAAIIRSNSPIEITAKQISQHYAPPEARNAFKGGE
jgi:SH3-like domain-containing protein